MSQRMRRRTLRGVSGQIALNLAVFLAFLANALGLLQVRLTPTPDLDFGGSLAAPVLAFPEFQVISGVGLALCLLLPLLGPLQASALTFACMFPVAYVGYLSAHPPSLLPMEYSLVLILVLFGVNVLARYFAEHRERERLLAAFGQYVPAAVVSQLAHAPGGLRALDGEAREMTVMFCDIKGFTAISEGLRPPELVQLLNAVLSPVTRVVHRHHGTVDKYIGDAVMAFWGAPLPDPDHAYHAVLAALELGSTLERLRRQFRARGWPDVEMGTGINTGVVNVGNMGSEFRMAYTVVGDAVNLAARLETLTRALRVSALVTEATARAAPGIVYRELGKVRIRGRQQPVRVYEPVCRAEDLSPQTRAWLEQHVRALGSFYARRWDEAVTRFGRLWQDRPDDAVYEVYLKIVAAYTRGPRPPDWDGELALDLI